MFRSLSGAAVLLLASLAGPAAAPAPASAVPGPRMAPAGAVAPTGMRAACPRPGPGRARCLVMFQPQVAVNAAIAAGVRDRAAQPRGWSPQAIESVYRLPVARDSRQTVAVSIAFDTPQLGRYLAVYRDHYRLPPCTAARGCLRIVNQQGKAAPLPPSGESNGWSIEATLDVSMISVACPHCRILVVEGDNNSGTSLAATEDTAARMGAAVISNSYDTREGGAALTLARAYRHPGHTIVVASGDLGFTAANFPADLASVTAVGGTAMRRADSARGWREAAWHQPAIFGASGSGCSAYVAKPAWQHDSHCPGRTVADVAAVATGSRKVARRGRVARRRIQ
jgi:hypothetical protein